jgi:hypothetical protein
MNRSDFLPYREIHLDFHTSEQIPGVGSEFDPEEWVSMLEQARVNSITCFARCHHGMIYYNTQAHPERRHPHLVRNLLKEQVDACHARGIRAPIYTTVQWDYYTANAHPEWLVVDEHGCPEGTPPYKAGFYRKLCLNSPYVDFLKDHVREICELLPVDGFFFDIVQPQDCSCRYCRTQMEAEGLDPTQSDVRRRFGVQTVNRFKQDMTAFVRQFSPECSIFYNAGHVGTRHREVVDAYTHFELETLPSGGWGYLHFPVTMRYARNLGLDCLGMTGKFHTSWGDFHSFKNLAALQYEVFQMLAMNAKCMIGDQLPPSGKADQPVYDLVGAVFAEVERKEPWCKGAKAVSDVGVFTSEEFQGGAAGILPDSIKGATRMLEEGGCQFDILDLASDLSGYRVLVLPDDIPVSPAFADRLESYLGGGGAVIASFESGLSPAKTEFALESLGVRFKEEGARDLAGELVRGRSFPQGDYVDYLMPREAMGKGLPATEHVMYIRGLAVEAASGSEVLADLIQPYFDRTHRHFCSHRQTPASGESGNPGIVRRGQAIYFSHPIFTQYNQNAPRWCKVLFFNALNLLLPDPVVRYEGPSTLRVTVNEQPAERRWVVHLLHYVPERRGVDFDVIEDVISLFDVKVSVKAPQEVKGVALVPSGDVLPFETVNGRVEFAVPRLDGHQMVEVSFV